ncbi:MAG: amino acid permease [Candidatus Cloacimonetes bacterium]|nr:amino acid permease [Candidatus Cloacimonadota bacterium]
MKLKKGLNFFDVFSIATGAMISSGIFILPGLAFARTGPAVFISYFLAGILALVGIFSIIELATAMPKAGGDYYYINRSFGPFIGTISGFFSWFALSLKSAFAIFGISEIIFIVTGFPVWISTILICTFFIILNIIGVKEAAKFQVTLVSGLLILMVLYIYFGFDKINTSHFYPFAPHGINSIFATAGFIFISFGGLLKVASVSEEVKNPKKNIPLGMIASLITVTIIYTFLLIVTIGILPASIFSDSLTPIADAAKDIAGTPGFIIISISALLAFITTANAGIMSASRYPLALSRDNLLPKAIGKVNKRFKTPVLSIFITGLFIILALQLPLEMLVKAASVVILTTYVLTNLAVIVLRESKLKNYRPSFKAPLYPWLQIFGIIIFSFFIIDLGLEAFEISITFLLISASVYLFYGRKKYAGEYALLHLLKRITDNRLTDHILESEFRDILCDRDNIQPDKFDNLVKTAKILDLPGPLELDQLFKIISKKVSNELEIDKEEIFNLLKNRQEDCNTAISPFIAIPHIIIEGSDHFFLMLIRCKEGIRFTSNENSVKAIFTFIGTKEDRAFHLKTLSAIATLVQKDDFEKKWLSAKNVHYLRDMVLLSKRMRFLIK